SGRRRVGERGKIRGAAGSLKKKRRGHDRCAPARYRVGKSAPCGGTTRRGGYRGAKAGRGGRTKRRDRCPARVFFFQAEDGIRDWSVTGVQTCALPISAPLPRRPLAPPWPLSCGTRD